MNIQQAISVLLERRHLTSDEMTSVMTQIMTGEATPSQIGGFLVGLRMKGETVEEVAAAAQVMRSLSSGVTLKNPGAVDIVGTGGDTTSTFNISTASALVAATAGVKIAKHGNRSVSSKSGAADLLEMAGVNINITAEQVAECVDKVGVGFMFAPNHHSAMRHAVGPRREMAVRTVFNLLGPLTNPALAPNQVLGVFDGEWVRPLAEVLERLGSNHVLVVHGEDGMDEISCTGETRVAELKDGRITEFTLEPEQFGFERGQLRDIQVEGAEQSLNMVKSVMANQPGSARTIVLMNAGAAIYVAGVAGSIAEGIERASEVIASGAVAETLAQLVTLTQSFVEK